MTTYRLPAYYASAIINNDWSGLVEQESDELKSFLSKEGLLTSDFYLSEIEPYFSWKNDMNFLGGDVFDFIVFEK